MAVAIVWGCTLLLFLSFLAVPHLWHEPVRRQNATLLLNLLGFALLGVMAVVFPPDPVGRVLIGCLMVYGFLVLVYGLRRRGRRE